MKPSDQRVDVRGISSDSLVLTLLYEKQKA